MTTRGGCGFLAAVRELDGSDVRLDIEYDPIAPEALDVFEQEPDGARAYQVPPPRVLATPHIGFVERDTYEHYFSTAFRQVREFFGEE